MSKGNYLAIALAVLLAVIPLLMPQLRGEDAFKGTDDQAEKMITQVNPGYKPWFSPIWEPPGDEVESMLFALQAAIGSGVLFYCLGKQAGRREAAKRADRQS